jgi:3-oxoacyl-[acyl-carrier protein] reductase
MLGPMAGDRILVVGGAGGIGAGAAALFGERAIVWSRRHGVDATDADSVRAAAAELVARHGAPFALVHTVGDFEERPVLASDLAEYRWMVDSNLTSAFVVVREVVPAMVEAGRGRVVLFAAAGAADATGKARAPLYFAAKAAVVSLARSLALELAPRGITVNVVSPGIIRHAHSHAESQERMLRRVPLGRAGTVADVLGALRFLLSDDGAYVTGAELVVDGGLAL